MSGWVDDLKRASSRIEQKLEKASELLSSPFGSSHKLTPVWTEETWNKVLALVL